MNKLIYIYAIIATLVIGYLLYNPPFRDNRAIQEYEKHLNADKPVGRKQLNLIINKGINASKGERR